MNLAPPDYVVIACASGGAVFGLFLGFSGALAFLAGSVAAVAAARLGWPLSEGFFSSGFMRGLSVALGTMLVFGIVRVLVRRTVKTAIAQPGDALFGALVAGVSGLAVGLGLVWLAQALGLPGAEGSVFLSEVLSHVG